MNYSDLSIIGFGYLQEIITFNHEKMVRINCLPVNQNGKRSEEVILNCLVEDPLLKAKLMRYSRYIDTGSSILVKFNVNYLETTGFQSCLTKNDPDHILNIAAKLIAINKVYVDGVRSLSVAVA